MSTWALIGAFAGGMGLFLLGMHLMTEGLKVAAGSALRDVLRAGTRTRFHGLLSGLVFTGIVQSSSAVTVAAIGFVNAGLLTLSQAVWVIFGSNVGTTVTGWIVTVTGLDLDIAALALPAIGAGMFLRLLGRGDRRGPIGEAVAGLGLFFLGLAFLKDAFSGLAQSIDVAAFQMHGVVGSVVYLLVGAGLTVATQSSSASLALTLTATATGVIDMGNGAAMVIGANLGTTSTAVFASIGATANARRAAAAHVVFNILAALVAFVLLPGILWLLHVGLEMMGDPIGPGTVLALFHTVFNVLGVIIAWPLSGRLVAALEKRFTTREEEEGRPKHLDATVLSVPDVALEAFFEETKRVASLGCRLLADALAPVPATSAALERRHLALEQLTAAVAEHMRRLDRSGMTEDVAQGLQALLRSTQHYLIAADQAETVSKLRHEGRDEERASKTLPEWLAACRAVALAADPTREGFSLAEGEQAYGALDARYEQARMDLVRDAAAGARAAHAVLWRRHLMAEARRGAKHLVRGIERMQVLLDRSPR